MAFIKIMYYSESNDSEIDHSIECQDILKTYRSTNVVINVHSDIMYMYFEVTITILSNKK